MRLLSCVGADVPGLVLEPVEGLIAHGALVGTRKLRGRLDGLCTGGQGPVRAKKTNCSHVDFGGWLLVLLLLRRNQIPLRRNLWIQQTGKIHCRLCSLHETALQTESLISQLLVYAVLVLFQVNCTQCMQPRKVIGEAEGMLSLILWQSGNVVFLAG
jgi:hypothetical protein